MHVQYARDVHGIILAVCVCVVCYGSDALVNSEVRSRSGIPPEQAGKRAVCVGHSIDERCETAFNGIGPRASEPAIYARDLASAGQKLALIRFPAALTDTPLLGHQYVKLCLNRCTPTWNNRSCQAMARRFTTCRCKLAATLDPTDVLFGICKRIVKKPHGICRSHNPIFKSLLQLSAKTSD